MIRTALATFAVFGAVLVASPSQAADLNCDLNNPSPACTTDLNKPVPPKPIRPRVRHFR